jgi:hypothetical protein
MNTMTFTIESVHGVKQTLVLGVSTPTSVADAGKDQGCDFDRRVTSGSSSSGR